MRIRLWPVLLCLFFLPLSAKEQKDSAPKFIQGTVLSVDGDQVVLNLGKKHGVVPKMTFDLFAQGEVVQLPMTGEVFLKKPVVVGHIFDITDIRNGECRGRVRASVTVKPGMHVLGIPISNKDNAPPIIKAVSEYDTLSAGTVYTASARVSDPENDALTYYWEGKGVFLWETQTLVPTVTFETLPGQKEVTLTLTVHDGTESSKRSQTLKVKDNMAQVMATPWALERTFAGEQEVQAPFVSPRDVAVDRHNRIYILDEDTNRIHVTDHYLRPLRSFAGSGSKLGFLDEPTHMHVLNNEVVVADSGRQKIVFYNLDGTANREFGKAGSLNGQFQEPVDVAQTAQGHLLVLDRERADLQLFDTKGYFMLRFGVPGPNKGQLLSPAALVVDKKGHIFVVDPERGKLLKFAPDFHFLGETTAGHSTDLTLSPNHETLYLSDPTAKRIWAINTEDLSPQTWTFNNAHTPFPLKEPAGLVCSVFGEILVTDLEDGALKRFTPKGQFTGTWSGASLKFGALKGLCALADGSVYALDGGDGYIFRFDHKGWCTHKFAGDQAKKGGLDEPVAMAVDHKNNLHVLDDDTGKIQVYSAPGTYLRAYGQTGEGLGVWGRAFDLSVAGDQSAVLDTQDEKIVVRKNQDTQDPEPREWGGPNNPLADAEQVALFPDQTCVTTNTDHQTILVFDPKTGGQTQFGRTGDGLGEFRDISDLAPAPGKTLWVADKERQDLQLLSLKGQPLTQIKNAALFTRPTVLCMDPLGKLYVYDQASHKILVFVHRSN